MLWRTHLITGLAAGYMVAGGDTNTLLAASVAALLPDIDHPNSYLGSKIPILPRLINFTLGHRGPLHSVPAAIAVSMIAWAFLGPTMGVAAGAGYLAHLLGDMLTPSGVPLLWPIYKKDIKLPLVKTGGLLERFLVFPGLLLGVAMLTIPSLIK